jgi:hypothetical protein
MDADKYRLPEGEFQDEVKRQWGGVMGELPRLEKRQQMFSLPTDLTAPPMLPSLR